MSAVKTMAFSTTDWVAFCFLGTGKSIAIMAVGSSTDWNIADQYARYLKAKGFDVSFSRTSETVPPADHKIIIRDDPGISPIIVIIDPSAL